MEANTWLTWITFLSVCDAYEDTAEVEELDPTGIVDWEIEDKK
jgi:hypothetical protein